MDTTKNFGPLVSGYLPTDQRAWETTVFQAGKPVLDKELNLAQDLDIGAAQSANRACMPSGWLMADCLRLADPTSAIFTSITTANALRIPDLLAHVNGWVIPVTRTNSDTILGQDVNQLDLGAGPAGVGSRRTDLVILEVWRKLIACAPATDGKSPSFRIWLNGNVKLGATDDAALDLVDDLFDTSVGSETTKRVQIQYRLRVIQDVDLLTYPRGLDDPSIIANSVPANALAPEGVATAYGYVLSADDPGLWIAGDGIPANDLHTVDGWMYAIPLLAVFRRNIDPLGFDKNTNNNGGVAFPGPSDRPDGFFYDIVESRDVADLRAAVNPTGWNYAEVLEKNVNLLLDNNLRSEWITTAPQGGGNDGHTVLFADEINVDTPGAQLIGDSDRVARTFSDRSTYEIVTAVVQPPLGGWVDGATFIINPTSMEIYPFAAGFDWATHTSGREVWMDIVGARWLALPGGPVTQSPDAKSRFLLVQNLGEMPVVSLNFTFDNTVTALGLTTEALYVDILVAYPAGRGLTKTPTNDWNTASIILNNPALPALLAPPASFTALATTNEFDYPHREVRTQYLAAEVSHLRFYSQTTTRSFILPERAESITYFRNESYAPGLFPVTLDASGRVVTLTNPLDPDCLPADILNVSYIPLRPMPQVGESMTFYYEARAPQAVRSSLLISDLQVIPRYISNKMYVITAGSGSQGEGYPFPYAYNQTGGIYPSSASTFTGEHELAALVDIAVANFSAHTGMLQLPVFIGYVPNPEAVTFDGPAAADIEDRSYFNQVITPDYIANAYAQDLSDPKRHKSILPMLAELTSSSMLGGKGQLVLVLLIRWAIFDETNGVWFDPALTANTTTACVFRTRGNLFNRSTF